MKKLLSLGLVSLVALIILSPLAQAGNDSPKMMGSGSRGSGKVINLECAYNAVMTRESSIKNAYETLSSAQISELDLRAKGLSSAWSMENSSNRRVAIDSVWSTWKTNIKMARDTFRQSRVSTWNTFRSSMKACNVSANDIDSLRVQATEIQ